MSALCHLMLIVKVHLVMAETQPSERLLLTKWQMCGQRLHIVISTGTFALTANQRACSSRAVKPSTVVHGCHFACHPLSRRRLYFYGRIHHWVCCFFADRPRFPVLWLLALDCRARIWLRSACPVWKTCSRGTDKRYQITGCFAATFCRSCRLLK